jgi:hypothetical protein
VTYLHFKLDLTYGNQFLVVLTLTLTYVKYSRNGTKRLVNNQFCLNDKQTKTIDLDRSRGSSHAAHTYMY